MRKGKNAHNPGMIYSPKEQIPIGVAIVTEDGRPAIRLKYTTKSNQHKIEDVPLDYIYTQTINGANGRNPRSSRDPQS